MRLKHLNLLVCLVSLFFVSCQKELGPYSSTQSEENYSGNNNSSLSGKCLLTKVVQGPGIEDTTYDLSYDAAGRLSYVTEDGIDTVRAIYNSDNTFSVLKNNWDSASFTYENGALVSSGIDFNTLDFMYGANGKLTKVNLIAKDDFGPSWSVKYYYNLTFQGDNISHVEMFKVDGTPLKTVDFSYSDISSPNGFETLVYLERGGYLGMFDYIPMELFLHKNTLMLKSWKETILPTEFTSGGIDQFDIDYQQDEQKNITSSTVTESDGKGTVYTVFKRHFYYSCK